jgi:hypothetical protein
VKLQLSEPGKDRGSKYNEQGWRGPLKCHCHCHFEKLVVRSCLAADLANRQLKTTHFILGEETFSKFEGGERKGWRVLHF